MTSERIKEIQQQTAYPNSISVSQALLQVWNECSQLPQQKKIYTEEEFRKAVIDACKKFGNLNGVDTEDYEQYYQETFKPCQ